MKGNLIMKKSLAFTLAEVLITLAIIGVVAAMTIPSVIVNTNQQEFKTGLRKAVSVLNSAITMNNALEGETPYDNADLFTYLQQHMSVMKSTSPSQGGLAWQATTSKNKAFYTTDGMRFEFKNTAYTGTKKLHENGTAVTFRHDGNCGHYGLNDDDSTLSQRPCLIMVDVNGDRKPNPKNQSSAAALTDYDYPNPGDRLIKDVFAIMITDEKAIPYGVSAQKAMYQSKN